MRTLRSAIGFFLAAVTFFCAPAAAQDLRLEDLLGEALKNSPDILASQARVEASMYRISQQKSLPDPQLTVGYQNVGLPRYSYGDYPESQWMFSASQMIPFPGKRSLKGEMAERDAESLKAIHEALRLRTVARVKELYYDLFLSYKTIDLVREKANLFSIIEEMALTRYKAGKAPQQEVLMAQAEKYMLLEKEEMLKQKIQSGEAMLKAVLGRQSGSPLGRPLQPDGHSVVLDVEEMIQRAYGHSPEVKSRERMIVSAEARLAMAQKEYYPDVTVNVSSFPRGGEFTEIWGVSATLNIPLYFRSKQDMGVQENKASLIQAKQELEATKTMIAAAIRDNVAMLKTAEKLMDLYRNGLIPKTYQDFDLALSGYGTGRVEAIVAITRLKTLLDYDVLYWGQFVEKEKAMARLQSITAEGVGK